MCWARARAPTHLEIDQKPFDLYTVTFTGQRHKQCYNCCDDESFRNINTILYTFFVVVVVWAFRSPFDVWPFHFLIYYHLSMIIFLFEQKKKSQNLWSKMIMTLHSHCLKAKEHRKSPGFNDSKLIMFFFLFISALFPEFTNKKNFFLLIIISEIPFRKDKTVFFSS